MTAARSPANPAGPEPEDRAATPDGRTTTPPALAFERVGYLYPDATIPSLADVSFTVCPGEFVVLVGASGSGKSTLLRAACGLAPHHQGGTLSGHVRVAGQDTRDAGPAELAERVGTVLQDPETQVVLNTVRAELALPLELRGRAPASIARAVEEVALALGIEALLDRGTHELSGGELQRVALGAALAPGGAGGALRLFLLDEPTSQLDPVAGDELVWLLRRLNEEHGCAVLLAEHRLDRCLHHADRVLAMDGGRIVCDAPPSAFLAWAADAAPDLLPPAARIFRVAGRSLLPVGVKDARDALRREPAVGPTSVEPAVATAPADRSRWWRRAREAETTGGPAIATRGLWREIADGPTVLRGIDLRVDPGERIALMGRNGAGKSTLLRVLADLDDPTGGRIDRAGPFGLLPQNPNDMLLHDRVGDEAPAHALGLVGLSDLVDRHPRELSGGERQRLALAVVLGGTTAPAALGLDEPTRGMDHVALTALQAELRRLAGEGTAVIVATHDVEFAATFAERVVLMADGRVIADGRPADVLAGGWYFATQAARILGVPGVVTAEQGGAWLGRRDGGEPA
ncbi:MAG: ATP-binding cassette domain-containing protein [Patulibacter sp.]|nr:ATP-binding cassette domain-containing protein [Patulibacter sp.]